MELMELPTEVLLDIVLRLPLRDVGRLVLTCRHFAFGLLSSDRDSVWKTLAYRTWGSFVGDSISQLMSTTPGSPIMVGEIELHPLKEKREEIRCYSVRVAQRGWKAVCTSLLELICEVLEEMPLRTHKRSSGGYYLMCDLGLLKTQYDTDTELEAFAARFASKSTLLRVIHI